MDLLRSGVRDQPGQHGETLSLLKIQKIKVSYCISQGSLEGQNRIDVYVKESLFTRSQDEVSQ